MEQEKEKQRATEIFQSWFNLQKEFTQNWSNVQKEFMDNWMDASKRLQDSFLNIEGDQPGVPGKEMLNLYNTWFGTFIKSSKIFTDEAMKVQETWKNSVEKQMEIGKDFFTSFAEFSKKGTEFAKQEAYQS